MIGHNALSDAPDAGVVRRAGHWRRLPRGRRRAAERAVGAIVEAPSVPAARRAPGLSVEEAAVLQELAIKPNPAWLDTPPPPAAGSAVAPLPAARPIADPEELVTDLAPASRPGPAIERYGVPDYGLGSHWGATWQWTAQGWVDRNSANPTWRPVVTTTEEVSNWEHDTYLGVVSGEAAVRTIDDRDLLGRALEKGRETAMDGMVDAGIARGAHAVVGVTVSYTELAGQVLITCTGTAVTLRER